MVLLVRAAAEANAALGTLVSLMLQAESHQLLFLQDLKWSVMPPLLNRQFRLFRLGGVPCGYLLWAQVSEAVEKRLLAGQMKLQPGEWTSGERVWVMDILLPAIAEPFEDAAAVKLLTLDENGKVSVTDLDSFLSARVAMGQTEDGGMRP